MLKRFGALFGWCCLVAAAQPNCALVAGWTQSGAARTYTADNLFEYMDGNAEGYVLYNFREMHGVTCKQGGVTFVIDVSDMGDADFSYGLFTANRDLRQPAYAAGMGGQIVPRRLIFAKGKYYLEIAADPEGDHTAALKMWAAALEKTVSGNTAPPARSQLVSGGAPTIAAAGSGERPGAAHSEARIHGAIRFRQGVRGDGGLERRSGGDHAEAQGALWRIGGDKNW